MYAFKVFDEHFCILFSMYNAQYTVCVLHTYTCVQRVISVQVQAKVITIDRYTDYHCCCHRILMYA